MKWPNGHKFAFTVVDDTDSATIENVKPVYDVLRDLGMKTTKTAWMFRGEGPKADPGATCEDRAYLDWLLALRSQGFEIAFHNAASSTSNRARTNRALARIRELFGSKQLLFCNHMSCGENMYWGDVRLSGWRRSVYRLATRGRRTDQFRGHIEGDSLFWGDLCQQQVRYVRNFVFDELNGLAICPDQPYHDPGKPYVNYWFASSDGGYLSLFLRNFTPQKIDRLAEAGGVCIAYVHFAYGFVEKGVLNPEFRKRLERIAALGGWFAPASEVLDFLRQDAGPQQRTIPPERLRHLERKWLVEKLLKGTT
jgi:hypothetical protein